MERRWAAERGHDAEGVALAGVADRHLTSVRSDEERAHEPAHDHAHARLTTGAVSGRAGGNGLEHRVGEQLLERRRRDAGEEAALHGRAYAGVHLMHPRSHANAMLSA